MVAAEQLCWPRLHVPGALALVTGTRASAASRGRGGGACSASVLLRGRRRRGGVFLTCWLSRLSSNWDVAFRVSSRWPRRHFPPLAVPVPRKGAARVDGGGPGASGVSAHGGREARGTGGQTRSAEPSAGQGGRSAAQQSAQQGRAPVFVPSTPPIFSGAPHRLRILGVLVEHRGLGPRRVSDSGSGLGRVPSDAAAAGPSSSWEPRLGRRLPDRWASAPPRAHERALF